MVRESVKTNKPPPLADAPQVVRMQGKRSATMKTSPSATVSTNDANVYTPLKQNTAEKSSFKADEHAKPFDVSPFVLHESILNSNKLLEFEHQERCMKQIFSGQRMLLQSVTNTAHCNEMWEREQALIDEHMPSAVQEFEIRGSSHDLYKQLRHFQQNFLEEESWKYH